MRGTVPPMLWSWSLRRDARVELRGHASSAVPNAIRATLGRAPLSAPCSSLRTSAASSVSRLSLTAPTGALPARTARHRPNFLFLLTNEPKSRGMSMGMMVKPGGADLAVGQNAKDHDHKPARHARSGCQRGAPYSQRAWLNTGCAKEGHSVAGSSGRRAAQCRRVRLAVVLRARRRVG